MLYNHREGSVRREEEEEEEGGADRPDTSSAAFITHQQTQNTAGDSLENQ